MTNPPWWNSGVLYQIYPRSFADANGDGIGDLQGVIDHLDHLAWLGIDGIWLSPITVSPNADWGYDVADYKDVDPAYGDLAALDTLIAQAKVRGIAVLLDLVPNHTSDQHEWFRDARTSSDAEHRDYYVWAEPGVDGGPPNNWISNFGGPAWTKDERSGQFYLHNFLPEQPDLNWWNEEVRDAFDAILRFWWDRGIAGFRIDVCHMMIKDKALRDNPEADENDSAVEQIFNQKFLYNSSRPEVHEILRRWRLLADDRTQPRLLLGETNVENLEKLATFYGGGTDELNLAFNFVFVAAPFEAEVLRSVVEETERILPTTSWPVWTGSNHDVSRLASRWAKGNEQLARLALMLLLTLRGTAVLYYGDEIALEDGPIKKEQLKDPVGERFWPAYKGRDPERTPMPWSDVPGVGFTDPGVTPWLPIGSAARNVAAQLEDVHSTLHFTKALIALRHENADLGFGSYRSLPSGPGIWSYARGDKTSVILNFNDEATSVDGLSGHVALSSSTDRRDEQLRGTLDLGPHEGLVIVAP